MKVHDPARTVATFGEALAVSTEVLRRMAEQIHEAQLHALQGDLGALDRYLAEAEAAEAVYDAFGVPADLREAPGWGW